MRLRTDVPHRIRYLLGLRYNGYAGPFFLGLLLFGWGLWVFMPWPAFDEATYHLMYRIASEEAWGFVMMSSSVAIIKGAYEKNNDLVGTGAGIGALAFFFIFSSVASARPQSTGVPIYFILMLRSATMMYEFRTLRGEHDQHTPPQEQRDGHPPFNEGGYGDEA